MKARKRDSTKGASLLDPESYKGDVLVQVWMDSRKLATLSRWLDEQGNYTRFMSEVVNYSTALLLDFLVSNKETKMIEDTTEARNVLEVRYRVNLNPAGKGMKNKLHNIVLSDRRKRLGGRIEIGDRTKTVSDDVKKAVEIYKELQKEDKEYTEELEKSGPRKGKVVK